MPLLEISILLHKESDSEMAESRKRKGEGLNTNNQSKKQKLNKDTSTKRPHWGSHQHAYQYVQYVAKKISTSVHTTFDGKLKFADDFLDRSSWNYIGTHGDKQFEIDVFFQVGRNGYKDNELLALPKDLFYSINRSNYVTLEDNELSMKDPNSESHFVIFEITSDLKKLNTKLVQLNKNIGFLIETKVIRDEKDIFIAGVATKSNFSKSLSVDILQNLPHLLTLHQSGKLFFVEQRQGPFEMLPEIVAKIDQIDTRFDEISTRFDSLSIEFHTELKNLSTEVHTELKNISNSINQKYTPTLSKKQLKLKGLKKIKSKTRKFTQ